MDSLISSPYLSKERELIASKTAELETEEKQQKTKIDRLTLKRTEEEEEQIDIIKFKKVMVAFRAEHESYSHRQLRCFYSNTLKTITYYPDRLSIQLSCLPWKEDFPIE